MTLHLSIAVAEKFPWSRKQLESALAPLGYDIAWLSCTPATGTDLLQGRVDLALLDPSALPAQWEELRPTTAQAFTQHQLWAVIPRRSNLTSAALLSAGAGDVLYEDELNLLPRAIERFVAQRARTQPWIAAAREREFRDSLWCQGLETAGVSLWIWNCREGFLECSHNMAPIYGLSPAEYPESSQKLIDKIGQVLDADDVIIIGKLFFPTPEADDTFELEYRYRHPDGDMRWLWLQGILDRDEQNVPIRVIGVLTDINERKQTALMLRDSEARFRDFMDKGPCVVFIKNEQGRYEYVNQLFLDAIIADHTHDSIIDKHDTEIYSPEIAEKIIERDQEIWQSGQAWQGIEHVPDRKSVV